MKKARIIALIVAVCLIITGGIIVMLGLSFADDGTQEIQLYDQEVTITDTFDSISIDTEDCNVKFVPYTGDTYPNVVVRNRLNISHTVAVEDGVLKIEMQDKRNWRDHIGVFYESMEMTVYLPQKEYEAVNITTATGDIQIPGAFSGKQLLLRSDTGDIWCEGAVADLLDCMTSTGDVSIRGSGAAQMKLQTDSGDVDISGSEGQHFQLTTNSGEVSAENVTTQTFICDSNTGEVELEWVMAGEYLQIFTNTGDVQIESSDAGEVNIETSTGDVKGSFLTPKWFDAYSDTGHVDVPKGREGGECRIQSSTGDIRFE